MTLPAPARGVLAMDASRSGRILRPYESRLLPGFTSNRLLDRDGEFGIRDPPEPSNPEP